MVKIIKYVTGFPNKEEPKTKDFGLFRSEYDLDDENTDVWQYSGPLNGNDFDVLNEIFRSDQFGEFKKDKEKFFDRLRKAVKGEQPLTQLIYSGKIGQPYKNKHVRSLQEVSNVSKEFVGELERAIEEFGMPTCAVDAQDFVQKNAKNRGFFDSISYSYPTNEIGDLSYDTKALVFVDDTLEGDVTLRKIRAYHDSLAGNMEEGKILINVLGQKKEADWNSWQSNSLRWIIDPVIRKQIIGEEEGIVFTRL